MARLPQRGPGQRMQAGMGIAMPPPPADEQGFWPERRQPSVEYALVGHCSGSGFEPFTRLRSPTRPYGHNPPSTCAPAHLSSNSLPLQPPLSAPPPLAMPPLTLFYPHPLPLAHPNRTLAITHLAIPPVRNSRASQSAIGLHRTASSGHHLRPYKIITDVHPIAVGTKFAPAPCRHPANGVSRPSVLQ
nr:unnamed protein product [Digitaria exilis]